MKAIICTEYGQPEEVRMREVEKPAPGKGEVLVKVAASSVNTQNLLFVTGRPRFVRALGMGLRKPAHPNPGNDVSGRVEAVGEGVVRLRPGDEVFGDLSGRGYGAWAEYARAPEQALARKPGNATFAEAAAACESALVALQGLRDHGRIRSGQRVLIFGASGGIGSFAVQLARHFGAEVTGICSARKLEWVSGLGAHHVFDYARDAYPGTGPRYDLIFGIAYAPIRRHLRALAPRGIYVSTGGPSLRRVVQDMLSGPLLARLEGKRVAGGWTVKPNAEDLAVIQSLIEAGTLRPMVDRVFPLSQAGEALRHYAEGRHKGKVILTV